MIKESMTIIKGKQRSIIKENKTFENKIQYNKMHGPIYTNETDKFKTRYAK